MRKLLPKRSVVRGCASCPSRPMTSSICSRFTGCANAGYRRTAVINQIRGLLLERGITIRKGRRHIEESLPGILEDADNKLSGALRVLLTQLRLEMQYLQRQIEESDKLILRIAGELEACRRLSRSPESGR